MTHITFLEPAFKAGSLDPDFWMNIDKLRQDLLELSITEVSSSRYIKQHTYNIDVQSRYLYKENSLYLLVRLGAKLHENIEAAKKLIDDVRTITPISVSDTSLQSLDIITQEEVVLHMQQASDDEEVDVEQLTDDDQFIIRDYNENETAGNNLRIVNRGLWTNTEIDENSILHMVPNNRAIYADTGAKRQAFMLFLITKIVRLLRSNSYLTKRDLFYQSLPFCKSENRKKSVSGLSPPADTTRGNENEKENNEIDSNENGNREKEIIGKDGTEEEKNDEKHSQSILDTMLDDLCCLLGCSKINLNILVQSKAIVYGDLTFELDTGETFNCHEKSEGICIPNARNAIVKIKSGAKFILVIEKDAILQRLISKDITDKFKVILFTGKGYPDWNGRAFLRFLWLKLRLPTFLLTDSDAHGIEIACTYRFGSLSMAYDSFNLALPHIKWLGLLPSDMRNLKDEILNDDKLPLTSNDRRKLNNFLTRPYMLKNRAWADQIRILKEANYKVEIEGLDKKVGDEGLLRYLTNKIRHGKWI